MQFAALAAISTLAIPLVSALDCSKDETIANYQFEKFMAAPYTNVVSLEKDTPPTTSTLTWNLNICGSRDLPAECDPNDVICGIQKVKFAKDTRTTQVIEFGSDASAHFATAESDDGAEELTLRVDGAQWGDSSISALIRFQCSASADDDAIELVSWNESRLVLRWATGAACPRDEKNRDGKQREPEHSDPQQESWGWFTWLFIYVVLALAIYIIASAWAQSNGDLRYIVSDSAERAVALARAVPDYVREMFNASRGGYSAV